MPTKSGRYTTREVCQILGIKKPETFRKLYVHTGKIAPVSVGGSRGDLWDCRDIHDLLDQERFIRTA